MNVLDPAGPQAGAVATLFWWMFAVATAVYVVVLAAFAIAGRRRRRRGDTEVVVRPTAAESRRHAVALAVAAGSTALILLAFLFTEYGVSRALALEEEGSREVITIDVTGYQWWWKVQYPHPDPSQMVTTANEIHVPVGVPVNIRLHSRDVIHSLWIPSLRGKRDLIPGYQTHMAFRADRPGIYRAQCAEFCGHQHARMGLVVVAEPRDRFDAWLARQKQPAAAPRDSLAAEGLRTFLAGPCATCHTIGGTPAQGNVGPDLTHLASRLTIGAGTLPMTPGGLAGWIVDPQGIKPGVRMPSNALTGRQLQALVAYLGALQ